MREGGGKTCKKTVKQLKMHDVRLRIFWHSPYHAKEREARFRGSRYGIAAMDGGRFASAPCASPNTLVQPISGNVSKGALPILRTVVRGEKKKEEEWENSI